MIGVTSDVSWASKEHHINRKQSNMNTTIKTHMLARHSESVTKDPNKRETTPHKSNYTNWDSFMCNYPQASLNPLPFSRHLV